MNRSGSRRRAVPAGPPHDVAVVSAQPPRPPARLSFFSWSPERRRPSPASSPRLTSVGRPAIAWLSAAAWCCSRLRLPRWTEARTSSATTTSSTQAR
ncbi:hypothetical protein MRQ36_05470 [Micromonospora sp. R77]|uniref:hypothetical protein n=1 Tax=Micromonospora sp. R77 TaxID=2925836 RepID=UPI001F619D41|nr:hypothetical protein [Micromonospora sp. R77]MCI4062040.1 hypothetical protein [Micromonospora sp. R77]